MTTSKLCGLWRPLLAISIKVRVLATIGRCSGQGQENGLVTNQTNLLTKVSDFLTNHFNKLLPRAPVLIISPLVH